MVELMKKYKSDQIERFKEAAKDVGADTSDDALDKIMDKLDLNKKSDEKATPAPKEPE
ncbi:hypothetical protein [Sedimentitalea sp. HM32M-2]|uniref:hypothetical protein n=1 Tax=Sedimentitalea sp. HM32M-2 TaxID=3351566 RepID=UPI0036D3715F